jgi:hypothetical protein
MMGVVKFLASDVNRRLCGGCKLEEHEIMEMIYLLGLRKCKHLLQTGTHHLLSDATVYCQLLLLTYNDSLPISIMPRIYCSPLA